MIDYSILRENDIRGVYGKNITEQIALIIGSAFGTYLKQNNKDVCIVGYDNRISGKSLVTNLIQGLINTGINVKFLGMVTTPILNYATIKYNIEAGIMVTASHNPANENGFKLFGDNFLHLNKTELNKVYGLIKNKTFLIGKGSIDLLDIKDDYVLMLKTYINIGKKKLKIAIDTGNGTTSLFIDSIMKNFDFDIYYLNNFSDGRFPKHNPDPNDENNLKELIHIVIENKLDLGIAYDGDGDRVGIIDENGKIIENDKLLAIFAKYIFPKTTNKKLIFDVKSSMGLLNEIENFGGVPLMVKNGSAYIESKMVEENALIGGEYSGHIFFRDRFYGFDDGIYASLRLLEILSNSDKKCSELLNDYLELYNTPELKIPTTDEKKWKIVEEVKKYVINKKYNFEDIDGVRVEFKDGWALIRCSNTGPNLTLRFEAKTEERLTEIKKEFMDLLNSLVESV